MPRQKTNKTKLTLTVDKNLVDAAKTIGINLSAFLEIQLKQYLSILKNGYGEIPHGLARIRTGDLRLVKATS